MALYPDASVVLILRPAELWWDSYSQTTIHELVLQGIPDAVDVGQDRVDRAVFGRTFTTGSFPAPYEPWSGPMPHQPIPRTNDRQSFRELFGLAQPPATPGEPNTRERAEGAERALRARRPIVGVMSQDIGDESASGHHTAHCRWPPLHSNT